MGKITKYFGQPVFQQATKFIKKSEVVKIASDNKSDRYTKRFDTYNHLMIMLYGAFKGYYGLRELVIGAQADATRLHRMGITVPARSTLADANNNRSSDVFKALYFHLYNKLRTVLSDSRCKEWEKLLKVIDSTTITLFTDILKGAGRKTKSGRRKGGIKVHTLMEYLERTPNLIQFTSAATHDSNFLKELKLKKGDILAMDRAYIDYMYMESLTKDGIVYVTKMKKKLKYEVLDDMCIMSSEGKVEVRIKAIKLRKLDNKGNLLVEHKARLIEYWETDQYGKKKHAALLTNNFDFHYEQVIEIYDHRWQIELLYKQLKQNFQLQYFYGESVNAIEIQIMVALIANLLMSVVQKQLKSAHPDRNFYFSQTICLVRNMLMYYIDMYKLIYNPEKEWNAVNKKFFDRQLEIVFPQSP